MTGGGARGAYQAGALRRIGEIPSLRHQPSPFKILAGSSAGAINVGAVASMSRDFGQVTHLLAMLWSKLKIEDVFRTDIGSLSGRASRWLKDLTLGGILGGGRADSLLDASPLQHYLARNLPFWGIQECVDAGHIYALAISATHYHSGKAYTFIQGTPGHPVWTKSRRIALPCKIGVEHICASAAIPLVFQPVSVQLENGPSFFGDGCLRLHAPLSPAIRLGARKVFAIGVRSQIAAEQKSLQSSAANPPPVAQVIGVCLNAIFLDHLDSDVEHLSRMNEILEGRVTAASTAAHEPMKRIDPMSLTPSVDIGLMAEQYYDKLPVTLRYFLEGLGTSRSESADLISYLLFDQTFTRALLDLGYRDAESRIDEIEAFLRNA